MNGMVEVAGAGDEVLEGIPACHKNCSMGRGSDLGPYVPAIEWSSKRNNLFGSSIVSLPFASGTLEENDMLAMRRDMPSRTGRVQMGYRKARVKNLPEIQINLSSGRQQSEGA